jgi:hypothetical protein
MADIGNVALSWQPMLDANMVGFLEQPKLRDRSVSQIIGGRPRGQFGRERILQRSICWSAETVKRDPAPA